VLFRRLLEGTEEVHDRPVSVTIFGSELWTRDYFCVRRAILEKWWLPCVWMYVLVRVFEVNPDQFLSDTVTHSIEAAYEFIFQI